MRKAILMTAALSIAACSNNDNGPTKRVSADGMSTLGILTDGAKHVAYVLNATAG